MSIAITDRQLEGRRITSSIAMMVLLVSFSMLFASLLLGYAAFRLTSPVWPPMGMQRIPLLLPILSTIVIALSSFCFVSFEKSFRANKIITMKIYLALTFALGLGFMFVQYKLWGSMAAMGLYVSGGIFPSLLYSLTWIHAAHIVAALISLLFLVPVSLQGHSLDRVTWVENVGKFWHFLGVVWLVMFIIMFIF